MGYGYDAMWLPVLKGVVDRADWMDGWQAGRQAGRCCGWEEREAAASFAGLAQKSQCQWSSAWRGKGCFFILALEDSFPSCFAFVVV